MFHAEPVIHRGVWRNPKPAQSLGQYVVRATPAATVDGPRTTNRSLETKGAVPKHAFL